MSNPESIRNILKRYFPFLFKDSELALNILNTFREYPHISFTDFIKLYPSDIKEVEEIYVSLVKKGWL